jgi:hypothetical protein
MDSFSAEVEPVKVAFTEIRDIPGCKRVIRGVVELHPKQACPGLAPRGVACFLRAIAFDGEAVSNRNSFPRETRQPLAYSSCRQRAVSVDG